MRVEEEQLPRRRDPLVVGTIAVVAIAVAVLVVWLAIGILSDSSPGRMTVEMDNPTGLTLTVEAVDADGAVTALGRIPASETASRVDVPVPGGEWTYVARYADREVWRSDPVTSDDLADDTSTFQIEDTPEIQELADEGFE